MLVFDREIVANLGETSTYADRRAWWVPVVEEEAGAAGDVAFGPRCATLQIALQKHGGGKSQCDSYSVWEMPALPNLAGLAYKLKKTEGEGDREPFDVVVGSLNQCGCPAGQFAPKGEGSLGCKHRDALAAIVAQLRPSVPVEAIPPAMMADVPY